MKTTMNTRNPERINFKNFNLQGLQSINPNISFKIKNNTKKPADNLTISDYFFITHISKGSENFYFDFVVYSADGNNDETEHVINCYTKDQHQELKEIINELIKQA
jgi:hypothetical protein